MEIALHVMTKNGAPRLEQLFKSVLGFADKAIVLDTGSDDGSIEWLNTQTILPVATKVEPFKNFGTSRTIGMKFAKGKADWLLLLDDDMCLYEAPTLYRDAKKQLSDDVICYMLQMGGPTAYWNTRLVRGNLDWHYVGVTHEYLARSEYASKLQGLAIQHNYNHGPNKFNRDLALLSADIARDPYDTRTIFYLAQTLRDMRHTLPAIRYYQMRANMGGWAEEVYFAMYEAARLAEDPKAMMEAFGFRPTRAEPCAWLRDYYKNKNMTNESKYWEEKRSEIPMPDDILFVTPAAYGPLRKV